MSPSSSLPRLSGRLLRRLPLLLAIGLIKTYQWTISPLLGANCRFEPSCSAYAVEALRRHGLARGGWLALTRLLRCNPWSRWGYDPVPEKPSGHRSHACCRLSEPASGASARP